MVNFHIYLFNNYLIVNLIFNIGERRGPIGINNLCATCE